MTLRGVLLFAMLTFPGLAMAMPVDHAPGTPRARVAPNKLVTLGGPKVNKGKLPDAAAQSVSAKPMRFVSPGKINRAPNNKVGTKSHH
jgi:hypothetical protein